MSEIWKKVIGYENTYEVSNLGNIKSLSRIDSRNRVRGGFLMKLTKRVRDGYVEVGLSKAGKVKRVKVHTIVLNAFLGNKPTMSHQALHFNGVRSDNFVGNLSWGTAKENCEDRDIHGKTARGEKNKGGGKLTEENVRRIKERLIYGEGVTQ